MSSGLTHPPPPSMLPGEDLWSAWLPVFSASFCILLLEVLLTRLFSVVLGYHYAFFAIGAAMFGLGSAGIAVHAQPTVFRPERALSQTGRSFAALALLLPVVLVLLLNLPVAMGPGILGALSAAAFYVVIAVPFFLGGICLVLVFTHHARQSNALYACDLGAAAAGCLLALPLLELLGAPAAVLTVALLAALVALVLSVREERDPSAPTSRSARRWMRAAMWIGAAGALGLLAALTAPWARSAIIGFGRRRFEQDPAYAGLRHDFDHYLNLYVAQELDTILAAVRSYGLFLAGCALLALVGIWILSRKKAEESSRLPGPGIVGRVFLLVCLLALQVLQARTGVVKVRFARGRFEPAGIFEAWNSFSRIKVFEHKGWGRNPAFTWGLGSRYKGPDAEALHLNIDSQAGMAVLRFDGDPQAPPLQHLKYDVSSFGYHLVESPAVLVIGSGGGRDLISSLVFGASRVVGVEINPLIIKTVSQSFGEYSGHIYTDPRVEVRVDEGRSYLESSKERFDLIQISLIDTFAAVSSGALALSENSLYTVEAYRTYLQHLTDGGVVSITRWYYEPPHSTLRLLGTALEALEQGGAGDPMRNILVVISPPRHDGISMVNVLARRRPFDAAEVEEAGRRAAQVGLKIVCAQGECHDPALRDFVASRGRREFYSRYPVDIRPVTDDRPFFFYHLRPRDLLSLRGVEGATLMLGRWLYLTPLLVGLFMVLPMLWMKREEAGKDFGYAVRAICYCACLGVAFILLEITLIQRLMLYLGRPVLATTAVLFCMLVAAGLGSFVARSMAAGGRTSRVRWTLGAIVLGVALLGYPMSRILSACMSEPLAARLVAALAMIAPLAFLMGMPFPTGLGLVGRQMPWLVPWMWATNAVSSVLGSVLAAGLSLSFGLVPAWLAGGACYALALLFVPVERLRG